MSEQPKKDSKEKPAQPAHPSYQAFTLQIGAAIALARQIDMDTNNQPPKFVRRFLEEFGQKRAG